MTGERHDELAWAQGLLAQTRTILARAEAGEIDLSLEDLMQLRQTEQTLKSLVGTLSEDWRQRLSGFHGEPAGENA